MSWAWSWGWWGTSWGPASSGPWWSSFPSPRSSSGSWWVRPRYRAPMTSRHTGPNVLPRTNEVTREGAPASSSGVRHAPGRFFGFGVGGKEQQRSRRLIGGEGMPIADTRELLLHELRELYDAEHRFLEGQVQMVHKATDSELQKSIEDHIYQTRRHIRNLEQFFGELGQEPRRETNEGAKGLVSEARQGLEEARSDALRDCAINAVVIKVEHLEIGSYRGLLTGARLMMGQSVAVDDLLQTNLRQEEETARTAEQTAEELFQKAMQAEQPEGEGLIDKVKKLRDRL